MFSVASTTLRTFSIGSKSFWLEDEEITCSAFSQLSDHAIWEARTTSWAYKEINAQFIHVHSQSQYWRNQTDHPDRSSYAWNKLMMMTTTTTTTMMMMMMMIAATLDEMLVHCRSLSGSSCQVVSAILNFHSWVKSINFKVLCSRTQCDKPNLGSNPDLLFWG